MHLNFATSASLPTGPFVDIDEWAHRYVTRIEEVAFALSKIVSGAEEAIRGVGAEVAVTWITGTAGIAVDGRAGLVRVDVCTAESDEMDRVSIGIDITGRLPGVALGNLLLADGDDRYQARIVCSILGDIIDELEGPGHAWVSAFTYSRQARTELGARTWTSHGTVLVDGDVCAALRAVLEQRYADACCAAFS